MGTQNYRFKLLERKTILKMTENQVGGNIVLCFTLIKLNVWVASLKRFILESNISTGNFVWCCLSQTCLLKTCYKNNSSRPTDAVKTILLLKLNYPIFHSRQVKKKSNNIGQLSCKH